MQRIRIFASVLLLGLILRAYASSPRTQHSAAPHLFVTLTPIGDDVAFKRIEVNMLIQSPHLAAGDTFLRMPLILVGCPSAAYSTVDIHASDTKGALHLTSVDEPTTPHDTMRHWIVDRATVGDVSVRYGTPPRPVSLATRNGPLYDLRAQSNGMMGAGYYFIADVANTLTYNITLRWDLSHMPTGARGVWSLRPHRRRKSHKDGSTRRPR